jgi:hypothetical protein
MSFQEALAQPLNDEYGLSENKIKDLFRAAERSFNSYVDQYGSPLEKDFAKVKEKAEILDGSRAKTALEKAAVRYQDLRYLKQFPSRPPGFTYASGTVTAEQYNALYADVKKLYELLGSIAVIIGSRV